MNVNRVLQGLAGSHLAFIGIFEFVMVGSVSLCGACKARDSSSFEGALGRTRPETHKNTTKNGKTLNPRPCNPQPQTLNLKP